MAHCAGAGERIGAAGVQGWEVETVMGGRYFELMTIKGVLNAIWQFCRYLFWPQWGSKCRRAQKEYERMLEEGRVK